jgi:hypothetical protein
MTLNEFGENSAGKETTRLIATGMSMLPNFESDSNIWYDCRELLPMRDTTNDPEQDITSVWCLVVALDGLRYMAYYNYTDHAWFESVPIWRSADLNDTSMYPLYKIAQPYKWRYFPTLPEIPTIQEDS